MSRVFPPFEPNGQDDGGRGPRLRQIPVRLLVPNFITVLAICAGMTGIRLAIDNRFELAVTMVLVAAFLDGIDGRVARLLKAQSRFGVQMDSLADIINFGIAPALVLYLYMLDQAGSLGWIASLVYAIAAALRLARFNVSTESPAKARWQALFFVGVPAPAAHPRPALGLALVGLYGLYRLPADQPASGLFGEGDRRPRAARSRHADHALGRGLRLAADELYLAHAHRYGGVVPAQSACRELVLVAQLRTEVEAGPGRSRHEG